MGLFNYVDFKCDCPHCGATVENFQTKDGDNLALIQVAPESVNHFYDVCLRCGYWIDVDRVVVPSEFTVRATKHG